MLLDLLEKSRLPPLWTLLLMKHHLKTTSRSDFYVFFFLSNGLLTNKEPASSAEVCKIDKPRSCSTAYIGRLVEFSWSMTIYANYVSLYNLLYSPPNTGTVAYDISSCKEPPSFFDHDQDNNIPNLGGISTTITSITILFIGSRVKVITRSLITPKQFTFLESKEYKS